MFSSELVLTEVSAGDPDAAQKRLSCLEGIPVLAVDDEVGHLAARLIHGGGVPSDAQADAVHIAIATVHGMDYLLTWNYRHIDNAATRPVVRSICAEAGYPCPEICTPMELLSGEADDGAR